MAPASKNARYVNEYLRQAVDEHLGGDASRFDELWDRIPNFAAALRRYNADTNWLHWSAKTFDGWYCVAHPESGFDVYYQERGHREPSTHFAQERAAIRFAIHASVFDIG